MPDPIIDWLLQGDVSIQYQTNRDLLSNDNKELQNDILKTGWGAKFLSRRHDEGHWGDRYYQPKWISSHYTLMDLRNLCPDPRHPIIKSSINKILREQKAIDGSITHNTKNPQSDVCMNGMFLNIAAYFKTEVLPLHSIVDFIINQQMADGGFNCRRNRSGAKHSSLHSTLSILEGIEIYRRNNYQYRIKALLDIQKSATEFLLIHQLYLSDRTGRIINPNFLKFPYPRRWRYDILSALDYMQYAEVPWDQRLQPAIDILIHKRKQNKTWNLNAKYPGKTHFDMEKAGQPSRWNTLRALRILKHFGIPH